MRSALVVCAALACASAGAGAQPPMCQDDAQCRTGYFCEAHYCRECFSCEELKRGPAPDPDTCVTTPAKCGDCLKGLVYDRETDGCVAQTAQTPAPALPWQVWVAIVACLVLVTLVAIVVFSLYRNPDTFKMTASARASVHHARAYAVNEASEASAPPPPQPPPPYNLHYPPPPPPPEPEPYLEECSPLVKRGLPEGRGAGGGGAREAAGAQAAQVFSNPNYVHGPFYPHSSGVDAESPASPGSPGLAASDPPSPAPRRSPEPLPLDEDTMESVWTPTPPALAPSAGSAGGAEGEPSASGAVALPMPAARRAQPAAGDLQPQAKVPRLSQDTNNNKNAEGRAGAAGGTSVTLNFNLNVGNTAAQQLNNVSL